MDFKVNKRRVYIHETDDTYVYWLDGNLKASKIVTTLHKNIRRLINNPPKQECLQQIAKNRFKKIGETKIKHIASINKSQYMGFKRIIVDEYVKVFEIYYWDIKWKQLRYIHIHICMN